MVNSTQVIGDSGMSNHDVVKSVQRHVVSQKRAFAGNASNAKT
jgi:hypothetical protein